VDVGGFVDALAAAGAAEVTEVETLDVDSHPTRVVDVTPVGDTEVAIGPGLQPGVTSRIWIVDQDDITPLTVTTPAQSSLAAVADKLVASLDLGPATPRPDAGSDEPWLFGQFTEANERVSGQVNLPVLDGVTVDLPSEVTIPPNAGSTVDLSLEGAGTVPPSVGLEAPSEALTADSALPVAFETEGEIQTVDQLESLFSRAATFVSTGSTTSVLGSEAVAFDYVAGAAAVPLYLTPPNDFTNGSAVDLQPNTEGRVWLIDTERGVLVVSARAEVRAPDDLAAAIGLAEEVLASLTLVP
jgi:hypothetical protein